MYRKSILMLIFALLMSMSYVVVAPQVADSAHGVTMYADLVADGGTNDPSVVSTRPEIAASATDEVYFGYVAEDESATAETAVLTFPSGWTIATTCTSPTTDADGDGTGDGAGVVSSNVYTYTFTTLTTTASTNGLEFCVVVTAPGTATNAPVYLDGVATGEAEFGATLLYIEDANDVTVTASVETTLVFEIREDDDTGLRNYCALGTLTGSTVATCGYRLHVETTASSGYNVRFKTDGDLRKSGTGDVNDSENIDRITDGVGTITTASPEAYGVAVTGGNCTYNGGAGTEEGIYTTDDSPLPAFATGETALFTCDGPNLPAYAGSTAETVLMEHRAKSDDGTGSGTYQQVVTYYVIANF